ncbi:MAG TPA: small multi-drug export protein [Candidatus Pacearchaeota archaeon]|jgi:uncharacterized membrane protein|nr:small multi-drug export protein [Candidatus Pacearchaeota archaeon]
MIELIKTFLLAMTPIGELRIAIPMAVTIYGLNPIIAYIISVLGNLFIVAILLTLLNKVSSFLSRYSSFFKRFFDKLFSHTRDKYQDKVVKYGPYLLILFVAIPLPITGGWTASLISFVFGIPIKKAFPLITLGILIAGLIVGFLTVFGVAINDYFGTQTLIGFLLLLLIIFVIYRSLFKKI